MLRKLTKRITNNFGLKILAAVFAIILWMVVVNIEDPEKTKGFTIPVTIENNEYLSDMGKTYEILNNTDKISFTVTGKRSIIEELSESDFTAVANLENINDDMTTIPVSVSASRYASQIEINKRDATLKVSVENLQTERFSVKVVTKGTPAAYCYVESTSSAPGKITVTGPESVVSQIKTAQAVVDISNAEENVATSSPIVLLDADGNEIPQDRLSLNRTSVDPEKYVEEKGLKVVNDEGALRETIEKVIAENPQSVEDYHNGKKKAMGFLVGQTMKAMKGKANPAMVNAILQELLA